ncbi:MAG: hypothetical protein HY619_07840 [Thaumarchaeota archaeon]|nr:hypothetical protein [Nitrososphaerota archaeon]
MLRKRSANRSRRGVSAIVGAVIMFAMVFTTGAGYFTFIAQSQQLLNKETFNKSQLENERVAERLDLVAVKIQSNGAIGANITNTGPLTTKIILIIVSNSSFVQVLDGQPGQQTSPNLPILINPASTPGPIDTGITPTSGQTYSIKVISERGNVAQTTFPDETSAAVVAASLIAKGVGDLQMNLRSIKWAVKSGSNPLTFSDGSEIASGTSNVVWKVNMTNHSEKDVYLSRNSALSVLRSGGSNTAAWYIVKTVIETNGTITALGSSEYIYLQANAEDIAAGGPPATVYFSSSTIGGSSTANFPSQIDIWYVFIGLSGTYTTGGSADKYSQLIPFKVVRST